jgi:hypothetical protein
VGFLCGLTLSAIMVSDGGACGHGGIGVQCKLCKTRRSSPHKAFQRFRSRKTRVRNLLFCKDFCEEVARHKITPQSATAKFNCTSWPQLSSNPPYATFLFRSAAQADVDVPLIRNAWSGCDMDGEPPVPGYCPPNGPWQRRGCVFAVTMSHGRSWISAPFTRSSMLRGTMSDPDQTLASS